MNLIRWFGRKLRAPAWFVWNVLVACWRFDLRDYAERRRQSRVKYVAFKLVISGEILLTALVCAVALPVLAALASIVFVSQYLWIEYRELWRPRTP